MTLLKNIAGLFEKIKPTSYKICKYPDGKDSYKYAAFYSQFDSWWTIRKNGTISVAEEDVHDTGYFYDTIEEAGEAVNKHATNGGSQTVWKG